MQKLMFIFFFKHLNLNEEHNGVFYTGSSYLLLLFMKGTLLSAWTLKVNIAIYKEKKSMLHVSMCIL